MGRTFIRQDIQILNSDTYDDTVAPTLADYETNPTSIEDDLNNLRSVASELRDVRAGNWWDALTAPSTLEAGSARGVQGVNDALHLVEKKRVLRDVHNLTDITVPTGAAATGTLTNATNFINGDTVTIDSKVYTFETTLTNVDGNVQIGGTVAQSHENLRRAINLDGVAGTNYALAMTLHPTVSATDTATTTVATAKVSGTAANAIATTQVTATGTWGAATLTGGAGDVVILAAGELPAQTTAAVGAVTTLGTVVAAHTGTFGQFSLDEVGGPNALNPKNLLAIYDGSTRDPILSDGYIVWGLIQGESGLVDGDTITDTTDNRVQISFVKVNATGDDLIQVPGSDIGAEVINYTSRERVRLEDLNEADFLKGAIADTPGAATTVTRQDGYDNQGTTPVDLITNATLDLEGPGLIWSIRDDLEAVLVRVIEGSSGGTSEFEIAADVDVYDNNAADVDFANGIAVDSTGTEITIGETTGQIDSAGALKVTSGGGADLSLEGALELNLTDSYRSGSTWSLADGISLADSAAEWTAFETAMEDILGSGNGEVSLLKGITEAAKNTRKTKIYSEVTAAILSNTDASGPSNDNNLDTDLGDLSSGTFLQDYDVFVNGSLQEPGADAAANNDYYPGTALANGQLKFEFVLTPNDKICVVSYA